ncbi:hypothetical protein Pla52n_63270 [Stieleria varia]|uniref:Uncharacterized protein n=1 Tax=Stieleria varia TaxID=2528005 RepID=A0A5C5ZYI0_9BACT|nr:hypothetical protein Pla52n_63270 [Stieleria varia]
MVVFAIRLHETLMRNGAKTVCAFQPPLDSVRFVLPYAGTGRYRVAADEYSGLAEACGN